MDFDSACLNEYSGDKDTDAHKSAYKYASIKRAEMDLKNLLKFKYGKVMYKVTAEQVFQLEGTGSKVLRLKHKATNAIMYAVVKYDNNFSSVKREIKDLGFKIALRAI